VTNKNEKIRKRYDRVSSIYDLIEKPMELMAFSEWREKIIEKIEGKKILEVGVGTGKNLEYYPENMHITGIDFSKKMLEKARERADNLENINLIEMDAQKMTFNDNSFDTVITSCVFCSVPDPIKGLKEIRRVCKSDGKIIMLEHMRSRNKIVGKFMDIINFIPLSIWGANINRETMDNLKKAGFKNENIEYTNVWTDIVKIIEIRNKK
jgi:ubiquinone/menaquinone biosynthesis C-methylase UbiE